LNIQTSFYLLEKRQRCFVGQLLTENNIPIISSETLLIQNASEVKFIINFLEYLDSANNQESKINWLYFVAKEKVSKEAIHQFITETKDISETDLEKYLADFNCAISFENCRKNPCTKRLKTLFMSF